MFCTLLKIAVHCMYVHVLGVEHNVSLCCCECEPVAVTMARARIWPASPQFPRLAFTFDLLDWLEALLLECQVSVKEFYGALLFKCPHLIKKVRECRFIVCMFIL